MEAFLPIPPFTHRTNTNNNKTQLEPGKFEYIKNKSNREMLCTAYKAINITENWEYVKKIKELWISSEEIKEIYQEIEKQGYDGHSGCSFMCTIRDMQIIALEGEEKFKEKYEAYEKKASTDRAIIERRGILNSLLSS